MRVDREAEAWRSREQAEALQAAPDAVGRRAERFQTLRRAGRARAGGPASPVAGADSVGVPVRRSWRRCSSSDNPQMKHTSGVEGRPMPSMGEEHRMQRRRRA
jgi:hypothetical protein